MTLITDNAVKVKVGLKLTDKAAEQAYRCMIDAGQVIGAAPAATTL